MTKEVDEFLDSLNAEVKDDPFAPETQDPFAETIKPVTEEEGENVTTEDKGEKLPFHKDPKVQKFIEKEISKRLADIKPTERIVEVREKESEVDGLTNALIQIVGNDTPEKIAAVKNLRQQLNTLEEAGAKKALAEIQSQSEAEQEEVAEAQNQLAEAFDEVEETYGVDITSDTPVARKTRNDFIEFIKKISPKNEYGEVIDYPDIPESYALFKEVNKPKANNQAKELSARSMTRSGEATTVAPRGNSWKDVDKLFDKLSK